MSGTLTRECPAKVNLLLRVLAREADGFHSIETIFCRAALSDTLVVARTESGIALDVSGADVGPQERNLAWRAADAVLAATGRRFGVTMHLTKRIPAGGGLGGGSSDAAQALLAVNQLAGDAVPPSELLHMASRLGADVPYFVSGAPLALAWGHGERLLALPALSPMPALLLIPDVAISTGDAYGWVDEVRAGSSPRGSVTLNGEVLSDCSNLARISGNDFESAVFGRFPVIKDAFESLARSRPFFVRMSGSGSSLFAVYRNPRDRDDAHAMLGGKLGRLVPTTLG